MSHTVASQMFGLLYFIMLSIPLQALKVRLADVTRETVQKSVCVLSRVVSQSEDDAVIS